jgi:GT2 family glycosyltransferase
MSSEPLVSVVIPTYNRVERLGRVLGALAGQSLPPDQFEVVVVSDGSTDGTDEYLNSRRAPLATVAVFQPNAGPAAARNHGVEMARAQLVLFVDDDVVAAPDLIEQHVRSHKRDEAGLVVIGPMLSPPDFTLSAWIRWEQAMLYKQYEAMERGDWEPTFRQFYTGNASLARATLLDAGGFDTRFRRAEDVELSYRLDEAGCRFEFNPRAVGWHYAERTFSSWLRNAHDYGVNEVVFARDHGRAGLLETVRDEFATRQALIRWASRIAVARPRLGAAMAAVLNAGAKAGARLGADRVTRALLSATYNVAYYRGVADELGGAEAFERAISTPGASS